MADEWAAAAPGGMRASHADRERAIGALRAAYLEGRLAKDELDARVGQALASRTYAELAVVTADIPAGITAVQTVRAAGEPALDVKSGICVTVTASMLAAVLWAAAWFTGSAAGLAAALALSGVVILTLFVAGDQVREARRRKHSAGPLPPGAVPGSGYRVTPHP